MKFTLITLTSLVSLAASEPIPTKIIERQAAPPLPTLCTGNTSNRQCCATDILGLVDLDCANTPSRPTNLAQFTSMCSSLGQRARCCAIPILGQALICGDPLDDTPPAAPAAPTATTAPTGPKAPKGPVREAMKQI
jgi:hydrophobin